ncbi:MAG: Trk family potassium uptake protein [Atopobiaceae bacterium]|nr:Trk family potassium uptake protein [Atopobiaceae bacterium]
MLPISSRSSTGTSFGTALFTATSATCVTGLVVRDTATHWSTFGQVVILALIQTGGLGIIMAAAGFSLLSGRRISLTERSMMRDVFATRRMGGIVRLATFVFAVTFAVELLGAVLMIPPLCKEYGLRGIWIAFFLSISAFCNAGFDILGTHDALFPSLSEFATNPVICLTICLLIVIGGIGFATWSDVSNNRLHFRRYSLQSKIILATSPFLIAVPALFFFLFEYPHLPMSERLLASVFQSITPRTAGFNVEDMSVMTEPGQALTIILMLIGGSPGSTAGGIKNTTLAVLLANFAAIASRRSEADIFGRRVEDSIIKQAGAILTMYVGLSLLGATALCLIEGLPYLACLFECVSAIGTVGMTVGITPQLHAASRIILIAYMFIGRVGGLTLIYAATESPKRNPAKLPRESVTVG